MKLSDSSPNPIVTWTSYVRLTRPPSWLLNRRPPSFQPWEQERKQKSPSLIFGTESSSKRRTNPVLKPRPISSEGGCTGKKLTHAEKQLEHNAIARGRISR